MTEKQVERRVPRTLVRDEALDCFIEIPSLPQGCTFSDMPLLSLHVQHHNDWSGVFYKRESVFPDWRRKQRPYFARIGKARSRPDSRKVCQNCTRSSETNQHYGIKCAFSYNPALVPRSIRKQVIETLTGSSSTLYTYEVGNRDAYPSKQLWLVENSFSSITGSIEISGRLEGIFSKCAE